MQLSSDKCLSYYVKMANRKLRRGWCLPGDYTELCLGGCQYEFGEKVQERRRIRSIRKVLYKVKKEDGRRD